MIHFSVYYHSSDHPVDEIKPINTYLPKYDWSKGDYDMLNEFLFNIDWHVLFGHTFDVDSLWVYFKSIISPAVDLFIPKKVIAHYKKYFSRHYPKHIRNLLSRKAAIWRALRLNHSSDLHVKYCKIAQQCKNAIFDYDSEREKTIVRHQQSRCIL